VLIAKTVPLGQEDLDLEQGLVAAGLLSHPKTPFDSKRFWRIGRGIRTSRVNRAVLQTALIATREDLNVGILGRERRPAPVRFKASKRTR
jgi:hypothetical protein